MDVLDKKNKARQMIPVIRNSLYYLSSCFESTGNQKMSQQLDDLSDALGDVAELYEEAFDEMFHMWTSSVDQGHVNMVQGMISVITASNE